VDVQNPPQGGEQQAEVLCVCRDANHIGIDIEERQLVPVGSVSCALNWQLTIGCSCFSKSAAVALASCRAVAAAAAGAAGAATVLAFVVARPAWEVAAIPSG